MNLENEDTIVLRSSFHLTSHEAETSTCQVQKSLIVDIDTKLYVKT